MHPILRSVHILSGMRNPKAQIETRTKEHSSGHRKTHIKKCALSRRAHPILKSAHVPDKHAPSRHVQFGSTTRGGRKGHASWHHKLCISKHAFSKRVYPILRSANALNKCSSPRVRNPGYTARTLEHTMLVPRPLRAPLLKRCGPLLRHCAHA